MAVTSLGICACTSSASLSLLSSPLESPLRISCYSPQLSVSPIDKTLTPIILASSLAFVPIEHALKATRAALSGGISVVSLLSGAKSYHLYSLYNLRSCLSYELTNSCFY